MSPRPGWVAATALLLVAFATPTSSAATTQPVLTATPDGYRYAAAPGQASNLTVVREGRSLTLTARGPAAFDRVPAGCTQQSTADGVAVSCTLSGPIVLALELADVDDVVDASALPGSVALRVRTGAGTDVVQGGGGDDDIGGASTADQTDTLYGGPGDDVVVGGAGPDYVRGSGGGDVLRGGDGLDFLFGDGGDDDMAGGADVDFLRGNAGDDHLAGGAGNDDLTGEGGSDLIEGGPGDDFLGGGAGQDRMLGDAGNDELGARDGEADSIDCGSGSDLARVDAGSLDSPFARCEDVRSATG